MKSFNKCILAIGEEFAKRCIDAAEEFKKQDEYNKFQCSDHGGVTAQETASGDEEIITTMYNSPAVRKLVEDMNKTIKSSKQWIDLDIDNLPDRFFTRDDIEIVFKHCGQKSEVSRPEIIDRILKGSNKYRYRIQEKKPIQISENELEILCNYYSIDTDTERLTMAIDRPVSLID